jgi:hypothetical protein
VGGGCKIVSRVSVDPFRILLGIEYIGKNSPISKDEVMNYLSQFSKPTTGKKKQSLTIKDDPKFDLEDPQLNNINKVQKKTKTAEAARNAFSNLKKLNLIEGDDKNLSLTKNFGNSYIRVFSGNEIFQAYLMNDRTNAMDMLSTNFLCYTPEIRDITAFIFRKNGATKVDVEIEYNKKTVFDHPFNQFTIDTSLTELERLQLIQKGSDGRYSVIKLPDLVFAQLLTEDVLKMSHEDGMISEHEIKNLFDLKYGLSFSDFDSYFSRLRNTRIPELIIPGSYEKFSINDKVAKEVRLI